MWEPATTPYDPACTDCEVLATIEMPHLGLVRFAWNPDVDDPVAQWADCTSGLLSCITGDNDPIACSQASACPSECRVALESRLEGLSARGDIAEAFSAVYSDEGAPCRPSVAEIAP